MNDYTVQLEKLFQGPADLLLQLVKEEEVDVNKVEIAKVCQGFLDYLKSRTDSDLDSAADFLVVAATLMWLKSSTLLPQEAIDLEEELIPKDDFLERLMEYRRFREAASNLAASFERRSQKLERGGKEDFSEEEEPDLAVEELSSWDLLENYARILKETLLDRPYAVKGEGRPLKEYVEELFGKIRDLKKTSFSHLFEGTRLRENVVGYFVALLELVKQGVIDIDQNGSFGEIELVLKREDLISIDSLDTKIFGETTGESKHV